MNPITFLFLGFLFGLAFINIAGKRPRGGASLLANGLVVAALIYVPFALMGCAGTMWLIVEVIAVVLFGAMAWAGIQYSFGWLALGWAAHSLWDFGLHIVGDGARFTAAWYPLMCITFDLVVAAYILLFMKRQAHA